KLPVRLSAALFDASDRWAALIRSPQERPAHPATRNLAVRFLRPSSAEGAAWACVVATYCEAFLLQAVVASQPLRRSRSAAHRPADTLASLLATRTSTWRDDQRTERCTSVRTRTRFRKPRLAWYN